MLLLPAFEAQYQQSPSPAGGNIIRPEWFGKIPAGVKRQHYEAILQSWDTAAVPGESNDYSVCTTLGLLGIPIDLLDVHREKYLYPDLLDAGMKLRQRWKPNLIIVEKATTGFSLKPDLVRQAVTEAKWLDTEKDKVERIVAQSTQPAGGEVRLPEAAIWKEAIFAKMAAFPNGKHDDQADSMSQAPRTLEFPRYELLHCSRYKG